MTNGFGFPSPNSAPASNASDSPDDAFAGFGLPETGDGKPLIGAAPLGVFDARCIGAKPITTGDGVRYLALEFELTDPDCKGDTYSIMGAAFVEGEDRGTAKKKMRGWQRLADACRAMGLAMGSNMVPLEGWPACAGQSCRLAVSTYDKAGHDEPTIVWGKPKSRSRNGTEVGFPRELGDDYGKFRDYGCGVLPST